MLYRTAYRVLHTVIRRMTGSVNGTEYLPERPNFIIVANHEGFMDAPVLSMFLFERYHREPYFITLQEMWRVLGKRLARSLLGMIPMEQNRKTAVIDEAVATLRRGRMVGIFPEGHRNPDSALIAGKTGAARIALASGMPVIPVGIRNETGRTFGQAWQSFRQGSRRIHLTFGPAISLTEFFGRPVDKPLLVSATRKLMQAISALCGKPYNF
ncbi:MAG: lysophospholipid acyltransferase family protein [Patescibacteria group bacterium]